LRPVIAIVPLAALIGWQVPAVGVPENWTPGS
jgi:hypothetical protein